jgi:starch phosphorylase
LAIRRSDEVEELHLYDDNFMWGRMAALNVASSGRFSSDRTIHEYATDIWHAQPSPDL